MIRDKKVTGRFLGGDGMKGALWYNSDIALSCPLYQVRSAIVEMFQHLASSIRL